MAKQLKDRERDLEMSKLSLDNLQNAINEQQESYDWSTVQLEKDKLEADEKIKKLEAQVLELTDKIDHKTVDMTRVNELESLNSTLNSDIDQLIMQKDQLAQELENVKDSLKTQELSKGNLVS